MKPVHSRVAKHLVCTFLFLLGPILVLFRSVFRAQGQRGDNPPWLSERSWSAFRPLYRFVV